MLTINQFGDKKVSRRTIQAVEMALGNGTGDYFYWTDESTSRYQGYFYRSLNAFTNVPEVYKILDSLQILQPLELKNVKNSFFKAEKEYKEGVIESYFLPHGKQALCWEANQNVKARVTLDVRSPYDARTMGRNYEITFEQNCLMIKFVKRRDWQEDGQGDKKEYVLFIAVRTDKDQFTRQNKFVLRQYDQDKARGSRPWERYVYEAFDFYGKKMVLAADKDPVAAAQRANHIFDDWDRFYKATRDELSILKPLKITDPEIRMAHLAAQNSLRTLLVEQKPAGAYAGYPWFFQFWHRDEAVALPQIYRLNPEVAQNIIQAQLGKTGTGGKIARQRFSNYFEETLSADGVGILARSLQLIFKRHRVPIAFKKTTVNQLENAIAVLPQSARGLVVAERQETWMDSLERAGEPLEIQCGTLATYSLLLGQTKKDKYKKLLTMLSENVKKHFYKNGYLWDTPDDPTMRPNVFLAYYLYSPLLKRSEWESCFDVALSELFLKWGGLASVAKSSASFHKEDTGELSAAYHNGDSWYWINNLAARAMFEVDPHKYSPYISTMMEASTKEILYKGALGHHAEISSANKQTSAGCGAQLWSAAMYLEFFEK